MMVSECPLCNRALEVNLEYNFSYCKKCKVAVREEKYIVNTKEIYNDDWISSQVKNRYLSYRASLVWKKIRKIKDVNNVLDLGCGIGVLVNLLESKNFKASGVDSSPEAIDYANTSFKGSYYLSSVHDFNSKNSYDLITATQIIEHIRNPEIFFNKIFSLLKPGGYLYIETPNLDSFKKSHLWRNRVGGIQGRDHRIVYSPKSLAELVKKNGFTINNVTTTTYPTKIFTAFLDSVYFNFIKKKRFPNKISTSYNSKTKKKKSFLKRTLLRIYNWTINSLILEILFYIPSKISEIKGRGVQIILVAQKN